MKLKTLALTSLTLLALAACGKQAETSVPADTPKAAHPLRQRQPH